MTEDPAQLLRRHELRVTPQRRAILNAFSGISAEHLSAEEVLARAAAAVPEISRGTVYATLAELTELGLLASVGNVEPVRYEVNVAPHDHFRCRLCLRLFDVDLGGRHLEHREVSGYEVHTVAVSAEGLCAQCRDYERGLRSGAREITERTTLNETQLSQLCCRRMASPIGDLVLAASADGICRVAFEDHADFESMGSRARSRRGSAGSRTRAQALGATFTSYFGGSRDRAQDMIDWSRLPAQIADVLRRIQEIPYAAPRSYHLLMDGLSAYDCGAAIGANPLPLLVPCHRVSRGSVRLQSYVGGLERLQFLQTLEGV
jgi:Fur family transcriptional regulator, stress-responsive regulator